MLGGILGRQDDMITVRGNNVFPAGIEAVIRKFPQVAEFRVEIVNSGPLADVRIELEPVSEHIHGPTLVLRVRQAIQDALSFRAEVSAVAPGSLPRFEMKARRFTRRKTEGSAS